MEKLKSSFIYIFLLIFLVLLSILSVKFYYKSKDLENTIRYYKSNLIKKDTLREVGEGAYKKLINDLNTSKELLELVSVKNDSLHKELLLTKDKLLSYTKIDISPINKVDTIYIRDTIYNKSTQRYFKDVYEVYGKPYITYTGMINGDELVGEFSFEDFSIELTETENEFGIKELSLLTPNWLRVNNIEVNQIGSNIKSTTPNNNRLRWYYGLGLGINLESKLPFLSIGSGLGFGSYLYDFQVTTNKDLMIGIKNIL